MLQRFDITRNDQTNRLSIKEFAFLNTKSHRRDDWTPSNKDYSLVNEVSYDSDAIRAAIKVGQDALIIALRSDNFFPVSSCVEIIAEKVTGLFNSDSDAASEVFFDDRSIFYGNEEK